LDRFGSPTRQGEVLCLQRPNFTGYHGVIVLNSALIASDGFGFASTSLVFLVSSQHWLDGSKDMGFRH
jgi:hypothetical protein